MEAQDYFRSITERLHDSASVKAVFGEPVSAEGRTIIPVARVAYGFGGGGGRGVREGREEAPDSDSAHGQGEGGGGGGGVMAAPVGVVEVTAEGTRFIPAWDRRRTAGAFAAGLLLGLFLRRR